MAIVKFSRVISFSSEHSNHPAENLISGVPSTSGSRKWRCLDVGEPRASIVLQASEPIHVSSIDIGNDGSAFVEVLVRRAEQAHGQSAEDDGFRTLLPSASFLTPLESRNEECMSRVRMFGTEKLSQALSQQKWDQFKVVCTQPFNKRLRYGLTFFTVHALTTQKDSTLIESAKEAKVTKLGAFVLKDEPEETAIVSLFAAKRNDTVAPERKFTPVPASMKSEATVAQIACEEENKQNRKNSYKLVRPDLSLFLESQEKEKQNTKKRKINHGGFPKDQDEANTEQRRLELKNIIDKFKSDPSVNEYEFSPDLNGHDRKLVHDIANDLSLVHESIGSGKKRRVVVKKNESFNGSVLEKEDKESKLPRRDILPGERPITPPSLTGNQDVKKRKGNQSAVTAEPASSTICFRNVPGKIDPSPEKIVVTKPFSRLMEGVKFVISGYQNPRRSEVRQKALDMGAKYNADWDNSCTHLVCAFTNTPKFNQVRKQSTEVKIVKCEWIETSYKSKIRYPWRRFCLDPKDSGTRADESEDEIWDEKTYASKQCQASTSERNKHNNSMVKDDLYDKDTDDEIEEVLKQTKNARKNSEPMLIDRTNTCEIKYVQEDMKSEYNQETDDEVTANQMNKTQKTNSIKVNIADAYNADTYVDPEEVQSYDKLRFPISPKLEKHIPMKEQCTESIGKLSDHNESMEENYLYDKDTDDEIEEVLKQTKDGGKNKVNNGYRINTTKDDSDDAYNADTDVDEEEVQNIDTLRSPITRKLEKHIPVKQQDDKCSDIVTNALPDLQTHFCDLNFFLYGVYSDEEKQVVKKCIFASGGCVQKAFGPHVDFIVCADACNEWDRNLDLVLKETPNVEFVRSQFITDCYKEGQMLETQDYCILKKS